MKDTITVLREHKSLKIYINNLLHFEMRRAFYRGMQSWTDGDTSSMYYIEISLEGAVIQLEYDNKDLWVGILKAINEFA